MNVGKLSKNLVRFVLGLYFLSIAVFDFFEIAYLNMLLNSKFEQLDLDNPITDAIIWLIPKWSFCISILLIIENSNCYW